MTVMRQFNPNGDLRLRIDIQYAAVTKCIVLDPSEAHSTCYIKTLLLGYEIFIQ